MLVPWICAVEMRRMPTIVSADSISSLSSRSLGDPFVEIAWLSTVTLEQYERLIERDDSFAHAVLRWLSGWFYKNDRASTEEQCNMRDISVENFMMKLETGVMLCRMAQLLVAQAQNLGRPILNRCVPAFEFKPWLHAAPKSFYARDNVENFTRWCRRFGVHESVLFESDGLVMHQTPRYVLLVLLELCRLCAELGVDPPSVEAQKRDKKARAQNEHERSRRLEREDKKRQQQEEADRIQRQEMLDAAMRYAEKERVPKEKKFQEGDGTKLQTKAEEVELSLKQQFEDSHQQNIASSETFEDLTTSTIARDSGTLTAVCYAESILMNCVDAEEDHILEQVGQLGEQSFRSRLPIPVRKIKPEIDRQPTSILDEKVNTIVNKVLKGAKLHQLSEGKYLINNRQFLVRLLNEKQVMVRVGGGWKSLEDMLRPRNTGQGPLYFKKTANFSTATNSIPALEPFPKEKSISSSGLLLSKSTELIMAASILPKPQTGGSTTSLKKRTDATERLDSSEHGFSVASSRIPVGYRSRPRWK
ncbi:uncharacterized protein LOC111248043 isoform X2 [Varroa destructor]|uniref:Uncharacterized protein n=1 Tax=Varroa destructor TaxID=109461 RepID=A0A7M7M7J2_VARDE|nr:uncharacterized protein LOC111248043 isoform X2 [Varroa destructor]